VRRSSGSALLVAILVMLALSFIGVAIVRFTSKSVAGATAGQKYESLVSCAEAARAVLESKFHALGTEPTSIEVLDERLDGPGGRMRALGGHIDGDPTASLVTIRQVEVLPPNALADLEKGSRDLSNIVLAIGSSTTGGGGEPLKVTVHCQMGDLSSATSGRQVEVEFGVRFGL
jgi:hypothetical protein